MSGKLSSLSRRLAKVERQLIDEARREGMADCICSAMTLADADKPEEFEAEMNEPCPAHGFRRLGMLLQVRQIGREGCQDRSTVGDLRGTSIPKEAPSFATSPSRT